MIPTIDQLQSLGFKRSDWIPTLTTNWSFSIQGSQNLVDAQYAGIVWTLGNFDTKTKAETALTQLQLILSL